MSDDSAAALPVVYRQLADARATILDYENREAACCPEDVGFEEYIATLQKQLLEVSGECDKWEMVAGFFASVIKSGEPWTETCQRVYDNAKKLRAAPLKSVLEL